ncbi:MAG: trypsin-like peptidase domain-containing protein [Actinomyces succiniciruminis]|nr:trypsin-like peptidase domain-containing protein [Actinomyces succiniciruminis]
MSTNEPFAASGDAAQPAGDETQQLSGGASSYQGGSGGGSVSSGYASSADYSSGNAGAANSGYADAGSSPYTSAPQPPAGYSFGRPSASASSPYDRPAQGAGSGAFGQPPYPPPTPATPDSGRRGPGWGGVIVTSLVTALLACGGTVAALHHFDDDAPTASVSAPTAIATGATTQTVSSTGTAPDWEAVTAAVSNSVVSITVALNDGTAVGSGVIYDADGHIITNNHVVSGASQIQVTLADGRIFDAELTGTDPTTDLAVIELVDAPSDLTVARFGNSDELVTGEDVMAIGNPLGLSSTATTGIISALNRPVVTTQEETEEQSGSALPGQLGGLLGQSQTTTTQVYTNAIQIDAAINPGNSGGPLFDETGAVIGITSSIASLSSSADSSAGSIGIGFAIPSNLAQKVADQLIETGTATHAYLGVSIGDGGATTSDGVTRAGAEVGSVESGSPADQAGIKQGDVITAIDGKATSQAAALTGFVRQYSAGDEVTLTIIRDGEELQVPVTLKERKDS